MMKQWGDYQVSFVQHIPMLSNFCFMLGILALARFSYHTISAFLQIFLIPGMNLQNFGAKSGAWAVVTGASDGIGKEFAYQLAQSGLNILLVARNELLLIEIAADIRSKYPETLTAVSVIDFSKNDEVAYESLRSTLQDKEIGVLVNNVGKSHNMPVYFAETPLDEMADIIAVNVNASLRVTHIVLPNMIERKRGLILNIGSFAGTVPSAMLATYSGSKAFLAIFSSALAEEVRHHGIVVEYINTYFVVSKLSKIRKASSLIPLPSAYVRSVLTKIGLPCGGGYSGWPGISTPYWSHALLNYGMSFVGLSNLFVSYTHNLHRSIRNRALKKMAKLK